MAVGKDFGGLAGLRLKLLLAAPGCSLDKALDGWAAAAPGYQDHIDSIDRSDTRHLRAAGRR